jgi:hypothetical protein
LPSLTATLEGCVAQLGSCSSATEGEEEQQQQQQLQQVQVQEACSVCCARLSVLATLLKSECLNDALGIRLRGVGGMPALQ